MSKRPAQSGEAEPDALPPIPDGGLSAGMPEWIRRPPAWRRIPDAGRPPRSVPQPDTTPIDPRTMLTVDDLPLWLQRLAGSRAEPIDVVLAPSHADENQPADGIERFQERREADAEAGAGAPAPSSTGSIDENPRMMTDESLRPSAPPVEPIDERSWWRAIPLTTLLLVCLMLSILIIVLYATEVL